MRLQGKIALITGGSHGIGRATAIRFAHEGAKVVITDVDRSALEQTVNEIHSFGGQALMFVADVQVRAQMVEVFNAVEEQWGPIHVVVNNAGICNLVSFLEIEEEDWERHIAINLTGLFAVSQIAARRMVATGVAGSIIQMSSVNGIRAEANQAHYNASKGGVNLLAMSMAVELAEFGIRVNALCPGFIETRLTKETIDDPIETENYLQTIPMKRVGQPEQIAEAAVFLASEASSYITGHQLVVDGGQVVKLA